MNLICMFKLALYFNARMSIGNTIMPCVTCLWITATLLQKSYVYRPKPHFISIIYIIAEYIGMHDSKNRKYMYIVGVKNLHVAEWTLVVIMYLLYWGSSFIGSTVNNCRLQIIDKYKTAETFDINTFSAIWKCTCSNFFFFGQRHSNTWNARCSRLKHKNVL